MAAEAIPRYSNDWWGNLIRSKEIDDGRDCDEGPED